jgi:sugar lactone lactonase YvrE
MIECVVDAGCELGEGPLWDPSTGRLYWIDIIARRLHAFEGVGRSPTMWELPTSPGALALREDGGLLVALADGLADFDPVTGMSADRLDPEPELPENRLNDGATDRQGRFWFGSMESSATERAGSVYRFDRDGSIHQLFTNVAIPNSLAFSPGGEVMYFADSTDRTIYAFDYDSATGTPSNRRVFAVTGVGVPDGSTVDADGFLWNAEWGASRLVRYAPDGTIDRIVELPCEKPTCCAFGGPELDVLYVTSARIGSEHPEPQAGGLFALRPGVTGLAPTPWGSRKRAPSDEAGRDG